MPSSSNPSKQPEISNPLGLNPPPYKERLPNGVDTTAVAIHLQPKYFEDFMLLEMQGQFQLTEEHLANTGGNKNRAGVAIGDFQIKFDDKGVPKTAEIELGTNTLVGKVEYLKNPILLTRKTTAKYYTIPAQKREAQAVVDAAAAAKEAESESADAVKNSENGPPLKRRRQVLQGTPMQVSSTEVPPESEADENAGAFKFMKIPPKNPIFPCGVLEVYAIIRYKVIFSSRPIIHVPQHLIGALAEAQRNGM